jgi:6-pyruvoyltetrahydropterin/6-carboxytetrahydropterin synthase
MNYKSTKIFDNYSISLRQWKAQHSHCKLLHGYALEFKIWFEAEHLDSMNWVVDFGGFKSAPEGNGFKDWMDYMFDHTLLIEKDDPFRDLFEAMEQNGLAKVHVMEKMGCESLAKLVHDKVNELLKSHDTDIIGRCRAYKVEVFENKKNSAIYES